MVLNPVISKLAGKLVVLASASPRRLEILSNAVRFPLVKLKGMAAPAPHRRGKSLDECAFYCEHRLSKCSNNIIIIIVTEDKAFQSSYSFVTCG